MKNIVMTEKELQTIVADVANAINSKMRPRFSIFKQKAILDGDRILIGDNIRPFAIFLEIPLPKKVKVTEGK